MKKAFSVSVLVVLVLSVFAFAQDTGGMMDMTGGMMDMTGGATGGMMEMDVTGG